MIFGTTYFSVFLEFMQVDSAFEYLQQSFYYSLITPCTIVTGRCIEIINNVVVMIACSNCQKQIPRRQPTKNMWLRNQIHLTVASNKTENRQSFVNKPIVLICIEFFIDRGHPLLKWCNKTIVAAT